MVYNKLILLKSIKDGFLPGDMVARQRFHLFKLATLFSIFVYAAFLIQISMVKSVDGIVLAIVSVLFAAVIINHFMLAWHKKQRYANIALLTILFTLLHIVGYYSGGLKNSTMLYIAPLILLSYMLLGRNGGLLMAGIAILHISYFYYVTSYTSWINYDLLDNKESIINFDYFITAFMTVAMITIQARYAEKNNNEAILDILEKGNAYREVSARLQMATKSANIGIWDFNVITKVLIWDDIMYSIFGQNRNTFNNTAEEWENMVHPEDLEAVRIAIKQAFTGERDFNTQYRIVWPDGSIRHIKAHGVITRNSRGEVIRMVGTNWDITNRILNETKIKELNESLEKKINERTSELLEKTIQLDEAQQLANIGNWNVDVMKQETYWSKGIRSIYGIDESVKADFETFASFLHPEDRERVIENIRAVSETGQSIDDEFRIIRPDGSVRTLYSQTRFQFNTEGELIRIFGITQDITQRKKADEELRRSEANLHTIFDHAKAGYILLDNEMNILSFNQEASHCAINSLGVKLEENQNWLTYFSGDHYTVMESHINDARNSSQVSYEVSYLQPDESIKTYHVLMHPVTTAANEFFGICITINDITLSKISEKETLDYVEQLQVKNRNLKQFAYMVSHNLRSPIVKIQGLSYLLDDSENENQLILKYINDEINNLDNVIKDMNTIITASDHEGLKMEYVDFETEYRLITNVLEDRISESRAIIKCNFTECSGIHSVKGYIYSILYNLISNAIKYRATDRIPCIHVKTSVSDQKICMTVQDNGIGIDLEKNGTKIFELYKRLHGNDIPGKGIGLSMVKIQAEAIGGKIDVQSTPGAGTTFKVCLPLHHNSTVAVS